MKIVFSFISFALLTTLALPGVADAMPASQQSQNDNASTQSRNESAASTQPQENNVEGIVDSNNIRVKEELQQKREMFEQKLAERRAAVTEKLSGKRAEQCLEKEAKINSILDNRVTAAQRHFDTFKSIEDKLVAFVESQGLDVENANAFAIVLEEKRISASAQILAATTADFSCAAADATQPGRIVVDQVSSQKQALIEYRDAIKDYAVAIKTAAEPQTDEATSEEQSQ